MAREVARLGESRTLALVVNYAGPSHASKAKRAAYSASGDGADAWDTPRLLEYCAERLILPPRDYGPDFFDEALALFASFGLRPRVVQESPRMLTTLALVSAGVGASVVVGPMARELAVEGVAYRPFPEGSSPPRWMVALAHMPLTAHSPAAEFVARWRRQCGEESPAEDAWSARALPYQDGKRP